MLIKPNEVGISRSQNGGPHRILVNIKCEVLRQELGMNHLALKKPTSVCVCVWLRGELLYINLPH